MENYSLFDSVRVETAEDYDAFVEKFKPKRTTDDCYTPDNVYGAVERFVRENYGFDGPIVRPFFPGGDYERHVYPDGCAVVDNPPFSILAQIVTFYAAHGVKFFLFAPALTLFSSSSSSCAALPVGVNIRFDNGADICVSFLTNMEPPWVRAKTYPALYKALDAANRENLRKQTKELPKYSYPDNVLTAAIMQRWCRYGVDYTLRVEDSMRIGELDAQRKAGKSIFGSGYLLSTRAAAERAAAERAAAVKWELSEAERLAVEMMDNRKD